MSGRPARLPRMREEWREGPQCRAGREEGGWALGRREGGRGALRPPTRSERSQTHLTSWRERTKSKLQFPGGSEGGLKPDVVCFACMLLFPKPRQYFSLTYALVKTAFVV